MTDFLWSLSSSDLPESLFDWQRATYQRQFHGSGPRLTMWTFQGEQPLATGLAALLAEFFRWRGPAFHFLVTRFERNPDGLLPWSPEMTQIAPDTYMPEHSEYDAHLWGELHSDSLELHFAYQNDIHTYTLNGDLTTIASQMIGLAPEILSRLGIATKSWRPDEAFDISDSAGLARLLRDWGQISLQHELVKAGYDDHSDTLGSSIRQLVESATMGSRFACWTATRALFRVGADLDVSQQSDAEEALVGLASVYPRVAWPGLALSFIEWDRGEFDQAGDLLETAIESDPRPTQAWELLTIFCEEFNQFERAEQVCREAIAGNVADAFLYFRLGCILLDHPTEENTNEDDEVSEVSLQEALTMLREADRRGLHTPELALRMMDACEALEDEPGLWDAFEKLIEYDIDGAVLWQVIEDADTYDDFGPGLARLKHAADTTTDAYEARAAYVRALIVLDRHAEAGEAIPVLRQIAKDDYARAETAQLALEAVAPDFEDAYGEVIDELEAGMVPNDDVIGLLQDALAREPAFADGAVALSDAYQARDEYDAASKVLSKAREILPDHLELVLATADLLWAQDNDELAVWTLQEALSSHPEDVAILSRLGEYYFETDEDNLAFDYLDKAKALDPRHPELLRVLEEIAAQLPDVDVDEDE